MGQTCGVAYDLIPGIVHQRGPDGGFRECGTLARQRDTAVETPDAIAATVSRGSEREAH
jgi:hypothetical protein